ncbi:hypothetical protein Ancab_004207 [Ancistrocladus abbreviatus]
MASGTLGAGETREKHRWSESSKVYTRKIHNKGNKIKNNQSNNISSNPSLTTSTPQNIQTNQNNGNTVIANSNSNNDEGTTTTTTTTTTTNEINNALQHSAPAGVDKDTNSLPQQQLLLPMQQKLVQVDAGSDDSSSLNRRESLVPNGHDGTVANGVVKPVVTRIDNRVNINLVAARSSKQEVKELKRKLVGELDEVRSMVKKLEAKEIQPGGYATCAGVNAGFEAGTLGGTGGVYSYSQYSANDGIGKGGGVRVNSEVGSVGLNDSRPFRQLTVSVMDNNHGVGEIVEKEKRTPKANQYYLNSDFVLGKEKFPPAESNKKLKSSGAKKHGGNTDYGFGMDKQIFKSCSNLLQKLMKHKYGWVFNQPLDVKSLGLHDYYEIIKHPMDLGTVKNRLNKNWYKSPKEFAEDVRLTFSNAMTYNPKEQDAHIMAQHLSTIFEEKWVDVEAEYDRKLRYEMFHDVGLLTPTSRKIMMPSHLRPPVPVVPAPPLPPASAPPELRTLERSESMTVPAESRPKPVYNAPVRRTPAPKKPKAKDLHKRDMTYEEKQRLSTNLQSLPSEKLDNIVQIIKKRDSALCQHDDEIEVDIDSVDAETLWELDRFVTNYKKSLSKHKRKAEIALQRAEAGQTVQETNPAPPKAEARKEVRADERNNTTSSPFQGEKQEDNASDSSSSSSSFSDSASSSSDSDSDSSSGYGSDAGH